MNNKLNNHIQVLWKTIVATVIVCSGVYGFFYKHTLDMKNGKIDLLEREVKLLETQIRIFETEIKVSKERTELKYFNDSENKQKIESQNKMLKNKGLKTKQVEQQNKDWEMTQDFKLQKNGIYQFPFNEVYTLRIIKIDDLKKELRVEFNLPEGKKWESLQRNKTRAVLIDDKKYNFLLKEISEVDNEPVAEFFILIKNID